MNYLLITLSAVLLALDFAVSKRYQKGAGVEMTASLSFSAASGLITAAVFFFIGGCRLNFAPYSIILALMTALLASAYTLLGFRILRYGNMALYTLFLMSGGMITPYVWGVLFFGEPLTVLRTLGVILILIAIVIVNLGKGKPTASQLMLLAAVFVLNGFVSVLSKYHQIENTYQTVASAEFVMWSGLFRFVLCVPVIMLAGMKKNFSEPFPPVKLLGVLAFISALAGGASYLMQLIAAKSLPATVQYPFVTGGTIIFSTFAGLIFFREKITRTQWISIALCFIGTCLFL
ncbi:MAG: DMT family transporter [Clostridia bacterium]|nr:DMT family transporter [Clostridia bacterium]